MGYRNYATANGFIVDKLGNGDFTTIAAAITAAVSGDTIFIRPGTYTENLTLKAGVNLTAYNGDGFSATVNIVGKCTFTTAGFVMLSGIRLTTNSDFCLAVTGSAGSVIYLIDCYLNCSNNTGISFTSSSASSSIKLNNCEVNAGGANAIFSSAASGVLTFSYCNLTNTAATTVASNTSGSTVFNYCQVSSALTTSSSGAVQCLYTNIDTSALNTTCLTLVGTGISFGYHSNFNSGTASAISIGTGTTAQIHWCLINSSNANPIAGTGTFLCTAIGYNSVSGIQSTVIQQPEFITLGAQAVAIPAGDYTVKGCDYFIGASSSSAHTITLPASPITGILYRIKDVTGSALINNITVSGNGNNIDGAATYAINQNYGSIDVLFNGTTWSVV